MKYTTIIDKNREEEVLIYAKERNALVFDIERLIDASNTQLVGYFEDGVKPLALNEIYCFSIESSKTIAYLENQRLIVKQRLYELEKILDNSFIKINQSCIINIKMIDQFKASFGGALMVRLKNGYEDYVSRRQLKSVKERIGF